MNEKLNKAMEEVRDEYIAKAAKLKKKPHWGWISSVAAVLALVILVSSFADTFTLKALAISQADYSLHQRADYGTANQLPAQLSGFFESSIRQILSNAEGKNKTYSPINLYMALALTGELTAGNRQILQALGAESLDALGKQANLVWNACYRDDGDQCLLANSLWLREDLEFNKQMLDKLAENYFTSSYKADFGSAGTDKAIAAWINQEAGNLLSDNTKGIQLSADTVFALYATVFYRAKWRDEFSARKNTEGIFHGTQDASVTFMNKKEMASNYYWGADYGAVTLHLKDGSQMWIILPDADKSVEDILSSGEYLAQVMAINSENRKDVKVNLSLPKFDISSSGDLQEDLIALGITDIFNQEAGAFASFVSEDLRIDAVNQATRVAIDEKGVTAASYIEIPGANAAMPPEEIIDFIVDRPFLFVITSRNNLPLFAGIVNDLG